MRGGSSLRLGPGLFAWWVVCRRDLLDLWVGGRALMLLLVYTVVIGVMTFLMVQSSQQDMTPPKEMVWSTLQICIYVGVFMGLLIGADSLSGARDREMMETLLLTPASRTQIVLGKFVASISPWPAALAVTFPCAVVVCQGDPMLWPSLLWTLLIGTILVVGFTGLGMLVSFWSNANRTSLFIGLSIYLLFLLPALLPGRAQKGLVGKFFQRSNPLAAADQLLERLIVNNQTLHTYGDWLQAPVAFLIAVILLLFAYAGPRLRLQAGGSALLPLPWRRVDGLPAAR